MDIDYVSPGDTVKASTINGLIDGIGGLLVPSEDFQRTSQGPLFMSPSYVAGAPEQLSPELLDVAWGPSLSGRQELVVNLGRDFQSMSKVLDDTLSIFFKDASGAQQAAGEMKALELSAFEPNGAGKYFDGWVKTGIFSLEGKEGSASACDGTLWRHVFKGNAGNVTVIANIADGESLLEEVKRSTGWSMMSLKSSSCMAMQTKASLKTEGGEEAGATLVRVHSIVDPEPAEDYQFKLKADVETKAEDGKTLKRAILSWYNVDSAGGHDDLVALTWNCHAGEWGGSKEAGYAQGWIPLLSTDWAEEIPEQDQMVWLRVELVGKETPLKPTPTGYLTKFIWNVCLEKEDDEKCYIGGTAQQSFGVRWIITYWPVGKLKVRAGQPYIQQMMHGSQNFLQTSWGSTISGGGGEGDDYHRYRADSELSGDQIVLPVSSMQRETYKYEYTNLSGEQATATGYYFQLYDFDVPDTYLDLCIALSDHMKLDDRYTLLVRDNGGQPLGEIQKPVLRYAHLSIQLPEELIGDSEVSSTDSWSVQLSGENAIQLFNFQNDEEDETVTYSEESASLPEGLLLLAKKASDDGNKLKYVKLDVEGLSNYIGVENALADLEASVKADTQVEDATTQSVTQREYTAKVNHKKADGTVVEEEVQAKYFMLYGFGDGTSLDKSSATGDLLLRDSSGDKKTLKYVALSSFASLSGDADADDSKLKSVTVDQDSSTIALHGFSSPSTLDITLDEKGSKTKDELKLLVRNGSGGSATLEYASLSIAFPEELDVDTTAGDTKSVDKVEASGESPAYLMLHNFNDSSSDESIKLSEGSSKTEAGLHLLARKGGVLKYATLEADIPPQLSSDKAKQQLSGMFKVDSESSNISSLGASWNGSTKVFSAWKFSDFSNSVKDRSSLANADLLVRDQSSREMKYLRLDAIQDLSSDSSAFETSKKRSVTFDDDVVSLYGFSTAGAGVTLDISPADKKGHLEDGYHLLARHKDGDSFSLMYADLSVTFMDGDGSSVEKVPDDPAKFQLLDWTSHDAVEVTDPGSREFLTKNGGNLEYVTLKLSAEGGSSYYADSEKVSNSMSLSRTSLDGEDEEDAGSYFSVAGFATQANEDKSDLEASPENYSVLLRKTTGSDVKEMAYASLADLAGDSVKTNWNWPKDDDGAWKAAGTFSMAGWYMFGCSIQYVNQAVPAGSGYLVLEVDYGSPASYGSGPSPKSASYKWTSSVQSFSLTTVQVPLWYVSGDTRVQYCSSVFTVPVYS